MSNQPGVTRDAPHIWALDLEWAARRGEYNAATDKDTNATTNIPQVVKPAAQGEHHADTNQYRP
jgi:hypothetical protein